MSRSKKMSQITLESPETQMSQLEALIENYVDCYNALDIDGMLACVHDNVSFENVSNSSGAMKLQGKDAMREVAGLAANAFTFRRQRILNLLSTKDGAAAEIRFEGIAAINLPNGTLAGQSIEMRGASFFEMKDGLLSRIVDYS